MKFIHFFQKLTTGKKIFLLLTPIISLLMSMNTMFVGLFILFVIDAITGVKKNLRENNVQIDPRNLSFWRAIKSELMRRSYRKGGEYIAVIVAVAALESMVLGITYIPMFGKVFNLTEITILVAAGIELWSIGENTGSFLRKIVSFFPSNIKQLFKGGGTKDGA